EAGYYLICSCGDRITSTRSDFNHSIQCVKKFTLHKLDNPKGCIYFQKYPKTVLGYDDHLYREHSSGLSKMGHYAVCSCGDQISSRKSAHRKQ
ncbi:hypothetical protein PENTCL1PPCAC_7627, partial [Pristionchus entomophagus]